MSARLDIPGCSRARVELMPGGQSATVEFLEHGIRLAAHAWELDDFGVGESAALPVRVIVDAPVLPTNASRSEVRKDSALYRHMLELSRARLAAVLGALIRGELDLPDIDVFGEREHVECALAIFLEMAVALRLRRDPLSPLARALLDAPILRNGCGEPRSYAQLDPARAVSVYRGGAALEPELAPWMEDVIWLRDGPLEQPLRWFEVDEINQFIERAREGVHRRHAFLAHEPGPIEVVPSRSHVCKASFAGTGAFAGLTGQVALNGAADDAVTATVRIFVDDRPLEIRNLDPRLILLPLDIALSWPGRLRPTWGFEGVQDGQELQKAISFAVLAGLRMTGEQAGDLSERPALRPLLRAAAGTCVHLWGTLADELEFDPSTDLQPLFLAEIWPTTRTDEHTSLVDLSRCINSFGALFVTEPGTRGWPVDDRPVLAVPDHEVRWIQVLLETEAEVVPYARGLRDPKPHDSWATRRQAGIAGVQSKLTECSARMSFSRRGVRGLVIISRHAREYLLHAGILISSKLINPRFGAVTIIADNDHLVPVDDWLSAVEPPGRVFNRRDVELEVLLELVASLEGDERARRRFEELVSPLEPPVRRYLLASLVALRHALGPNDDRPAELASQEQLYHRLLALPIIPSLDHAGAAMNRSILGFSEHHGGAAIPVLSRPPGFATLDWCPLIEPDGTSWFLLEAALGARLYDGATELDERKQTAADEALRQTLLERPTEPVDDMGDLADPSSPVIVSEVIHTEPMGDGAPRVAVALPATAGADNVTVVEALYMGRRVCRERSAAIGLPVVARVDLHDPGAFDAWQALSSQGMQAATVAIEQASAELASRLVSQQRMDTPALALITALVDRTLPAALRLALSTSTCYPTIQGGRAAIYDLMRDGVVYAGRTRYSRWWSSKRGTTELDRPVLYLSSEHAEPFRRIVQSLGHELRDVTAAVATLQQQRGRGSSNAPVLAGEPAHPLLRESAGELGVIAGRGQLELIAGTDAEVSVRDVEGVSQQLELTLGIGLRAMLQVDGIHSSSFASQLRAELASAVRTWLGRLAEQVTALPEFVRVHLRTAIWSVLDQADDELPQQLRAAPVWRDLAGRWHSIAGLLGGRFKRVWFTTLAPPYPKHDFGRPILRFAPGDADKVDSLRKLLPLTDQNTRLRNTLMGETRRQATPRRSFELDPVVRAQCLWTTRLDAAPSGELGLLAPTSSAPPGIHVHTTGRPLCELDAPTNWPIVAVINDDTIEHGLYFDRMASEEAAQALRRKLHDRAMELARAQLTAPSYALASAWIDSTSDPDLPSIIGRLWLTPSWKQRQSLRLHTGTGLRSLELRTLHGSSYFAHELPVEGELVVHSSMGSDYLFGPLLELVRPQLAGLLEIAAEHHPQLADLFEGYRWLLCLLDFPVGQAPVTTASDGSAVDPARVLAELEEYGQIWYAGSGSDAEGVFPERFGFILREDQSPVLIDVLRHRLTGAALAELGGLAAERRAQAEAKAAEEAAARRPETALFRELEQELDLPAEPAMTPSEVKPDPSDGNGRSWLRDTLGSITSLWSKPEPEATARPPQDPLAKRIEGGLDQLRILCNTIEVDERRGGAFDYDKRRSRLTLNREHPAVQAAATETSIGAPATVALLAAVTSEINRAHKQVTAADELHALLTLLERAAAE